MKVKSKNKLLIFFMSLAFLCGCWNIKDINKRSLPLVMGISKDGNKEYKVTIQTPILEDDIQKSRVITENGETVAGVLGQIRTNSEDAVDYSQIRLIVIQSNLANNQKEFKGLIKFLMVSEEIPSRALVAITDEEVEKVLDNINEKLGVHATSIYDFFNKGDDWAPEIISTPVWDIYRSQYLLTKDIVVPIIRSGKDTVLIFEGACILKKGEIIERINKHESQLVNVFQDKNEKGKIESLGFASVMVTNSSIQNKISFKKKIPVVTSDLKLKIYILEREDGISDKKIRTELEKLIEKRFYYILRKTQEKNADIFGFGQQFKHLLSYQKLKDWRKDYYPKLKVNFTVHANME